MMIFLLNSFAINSDENHKSQKWYILPLNSSLEMLVFNLWSLKMLRSVSVAGSKGEFTGASLQCDIFFTSPKGLKCVLKWASKISKYLICTYGNLIN